MTGVEEAVGRLTYDADTAEETAHYNDDPYQARWTQVQTADLRTLLADHARLSSALSEMQADISGKVGRVVSEEVVERIARALHEHDRAHNGGYTPEVWENCPAQDDYRASALAALSAATLPPAPEEVAGLIREARRLAEDTEFSRYAGARDKAVVDCLRSLAKALEQATTAGAGR